MNRTFRIRPAEAGDAADLARLFDEYRLFYGQPSNLTGAERFVSERIREGDTRFLLARHDAGHVALGFVHLIPAWNTLAMRATWYLEDLYVVPAARRQGVGRGLMLAAESFARESGAERLTLSTAYDNHAGHALYRATGYVREEHFVQFHRVL